MCSLSVCRCLCSRFAGVRVNVSFGREVISLRGIHVGAVVRSHNRSILLCVAVHMYITRALGTASVRTAMCMAAVGVAAMTDVLRGRGNIRKQ